MVEVPDEEKEGQTNKFKAHGNKKANTPARSRRENHKKGQVPERAWIADMQKKHLLQTCRKNTYDAKCLGFEKLGLMDLNFT